MSDITWPLEDEHWVFIARLSKVIDGDTYDLDIDLGFRTYVKKRMRLVGVDTAEIYFVGTDSDEYDRGMKHMGEVVEWFGAIDSNKEWPLLISTAKDTGKYGRWPVLIRTREGHPIDLTLREMLVHEYPNVDTTEQPVD